MGRDLVQSVENGFKKWSTHSLYERVMRWRAGILGLALFASAATA